MEQSQLRSQFIEVLRLSQPPTQVEYQTQHRLKRDGYDELRIEFISEGNESVPAFLLIPHVSPVAGILINHQHAGQRHFGKSEVVGLVGNPLQAFGPTLARQGLVVLAPDSICFEDRRPHKKGTAPADGESDWLHHYNAMGHRLVMGDTLMRRVLTDAMAGVSLLSGLPQLADKKLGTLGHSYGGNTVLFHSAIDERISFACASGAACSYRHKLATNTAIEMAEVIPGFASKWDIEDLVRTIAPRPLLLVSGEQDPYSADADQIEKLARDAYEAPGRENALEHDRDDGRHEMTQRRFDRIVRWVVAQAAMVAA